MTFFLFSFSSPWLLVFLFVCLILIGGQLLYNIALALPYINMNPPQVYTCSPSWTPLPPPSPVPSLWVVSVHQPQASSIMHRTWTGDSLHIWLLLINPSLISQVIWVMFVCQGHSRVNFKFSPKHIFGLSSSKFWGESILLRKLSLHVPKEPVLEFQKVSS